MRSRATASARDPAVLRNKEMMGCLISLLESPSPALVRDGLSVIVLLLGERCEEADQLPCLLLPSLPRIIHSSDSTIASAAAAVLSRFASSTTGRALVAIRQELEAGRERGKEISDEVGKVMGIPLKDRR